MRKKISCMILATIILFNITGCKSTETSPTPSIIQTTTPSPTIPQVPRSKTSGKKLSASVVYKPIGVMIENSAQARPQYGLQTADVVYEAPVEGSITRFFCIYNDTLPQRVGPVRSTRVYYVRFQQEWDCALVHFGGSQSGESNVYTSDVSSHIITRIDFITGKYNNYYWRTTDKAAPHNAFTDVKKLQTLIAQESKGRTFLYDENSTYSGDTVSEITLPFIGDAATYRYDTKQEVFLRYSGNKPFIDAETKKAVEVKNIIVQYNHFYHGNEAKGRWLCNLVGTGKAEFFINGKHIIGTWERTSYDSPTLYKDASGKEIVLRPGNTWIAVHPDNANIIVK